MKKIQKIENAFLDKICAKHYHTMNPQQYIAHVLELVRQDPCHYACVYDAFQEHSYADKSLFTILFRWLESYDPASNEVMYMTYYMAPIFDLVVPQFNSEELRMAFAKYLVMVHSHIDIDAISQNWSHDADTMAYFQEIKDVIEASLDKIGHGIDTTTFSRDWEECIRDLVGLLV